MKRGLILLVMIAVLLGVGCYGTVPLSPAQGFFLEVTAPQDETVVSTNPICVSGSTSLGADVSVNGELVDVDEQGNFAAMVELEEGPNAIEVIATDYEGNGKSCILVVIYAP